MKPARTEVLLWPKVGPLQWKLLIELNRLLLGHIPIVRCRLDSYLLSHTRPWFFSNLRIYFYKIFQIYLSTIYQLLRLFQNILSIRFRQLFKIITSHSIFGRSSGSLFMPKIFALITSKWYRSQQLHYVSWAEFFKSWWFKFYCVGKLIKLLL